MAQSETVTTLITADELAAYSGVTRDTSDTTAASLLNTYIESAQEIIANYLMTDPLQMNPIPGLVKLTCLRIASLIQLEENNNIGINSKSFGDSGTRSFLNVTNYEPYLNVLSRWRKV